MCLLGGFLILNTTNAAPICIPFVDFTLGGNYTELDENGNPRGRTEIESSQVCFDPISETLSLYVSVYLYDSDDNYLGYVIVSGGGYRKDDGRIYIYGSSTAGTIPGGCATASGELNGRGELEDGPKWNYASVFDFFTTNNIPNNISASAEASIDVNDITLTISVDVDLP